MARLRAGNFGLGQIFLIVIVGIIVLYGLSQFTELDADDNISFKLPADINATTMMVLKIMVVGAAIFAGYALVIKMQGGSLSRRDALTIILLGFALWWLWDNVLVNIMNTGTIDNLTFSVADKAGILT